MWPNSINELIAVIVIIARNRCKDHIFLRKEKIHYQKVFISNRKLTMRKRAASDIAFIFTSRSIGTAKTNRKLISIYY
jgi:hypothetical protein